MQVHLRFGHTQTRASGVRRGREEEGGWAECTCTRDALSARSPWTTSTPRFASAFALLLSGSRVIARTAVPCLSSESTTAPP